MGAGGTGSPAEFLDPRLRSGTALPYNGAVGDRPRDRDGALRDADPTFGGTTHRYASYAEDTTDRVRFGERTSVRAFAPAIPALPLEEEAPSDDQTVPDHGPRLAFGNTMAIADELVEPPPEVGNGEPESAVPGAIIADRYRVVHAIGAGGMGKVLEVRHVRLGKTFALKLMHERLAADETIRRDFFREAKFASSLDHPNILSVVDFGEDPRFGAYMVMEYIEGDPLSTLLKDRRRLSVRRACDIVLQLAEALRYIHRHNIIHCDIKTRNILLCDDPSDKRRKSLVKLLDFGLARSTSQRAPERLFGTPEYIAPEMAQRKQPTGRSDIYSLGILLFELITGEVPFRGPVSQVLRAHLDQPLPSPSEVLGETVDPALEKLLYTACEKEPEHRHKDMSAFVYELKTVMDMLGIARQRRVAQPVTAVHSAPVPDQRSELIRSTFDSFRLPIATIDGQGGIVAANAAFSRFVVGMIVKLEGTRIQETLLARAWHTLEDDLATACSGQPVGRVIELASDGGTTRLQMWLEPTGLPGYACFSVHPVGESLPE